METKDKQTTLILCLLGFIGLGGMHDFYIGHIGKGLIKFYTINFLFIGTIVDAIKIINNKYNLTSVYIPKKADPDKVTLDWKEYQSMLKKTEELLHEKEFLEDTLNKVKEQRDNLIKKIKEQKDAENNNIEYIDTLDGIEFEKYIAKILPKLGYKSVQRTPDSNDYGIDVLAEKDGIKYAIQCKNYQSPVGNKCVQEAYSGKQYYNAHIGVVVTNNYFTNNAQALAKKNNIILWDRNELKKMIRKTKKTSS